MKKYYIVIIYLMSLTLLAGCHSNGMEDELVGPSKVEVKKTGERYQLFVNGSPFYIKGAGLETGSMEELVRHGGNAIRTWRTDNALKTGQEVLDEAHEHGLMVCLGIELARERHGFDYDDSVAVKKQFEYAKGEVLKYKDHPALLAWGLGNELNLHYKNPRVWDAVNEISEMIHQLDPNHPTTTMIAGAQKEVIAVIMDRCPSLDFISFQLYGDIINLPRYIEESNYDKAYVVSEWGATGHWEVAQTDWGRPIEQNSHEKAMAYKKRYTEVIAAHQDQCLGSFVFLWGQKQERTPTWYGMFLESGEHTESMDVMQNLWTGAWPDNLSPVMKKFQLAGQSARDNVKLVAGKTYDAAVTVEDKDDDELSLRWEIMPEVPRNLQSDGGDFEQRPTSVWTSSSNEQEITFEAPQPGEYRLFVYAFDGHNNAATANIPFLVKRN